METILVLTLFVPLLGAIINGVFGSPFKKYAHWVAVPAIGISWLGALYLLKYVLAGNTLIVNLWQWIPVKDFNVNFGLYLDPLSAVMIATVTTVSFFIHIYSIGYMHGDPGYRRYFSYLNLFVFSMLLLVLANNYVLLFVGWEAVGLCSYLLIGFWYEKKSASDAGKKAFIVNRIGDAGFILGIFTMFFSVGSVDYRTVFEAAPHLSAAIIGAITFFLFMGAMGKSAQFPLYVWLPDAMEGPTPVSALIHAATMVTAGVYMVARSSALYSAHGSVANLVAGIGAFTAIFAASIALVNDDIKRVLAYSTISQLGYMFIGVGVGAYATGIFHLYTHAFFKALLFLTAGSVMHALHGELNMQKMGGLFKKMPQTGITFIIGALALSGIPPFAGFFSKDAILKEALLRGHVTIWWIGTITAFMTAFYMFRLIFKVFFGKPRDEELYEHAHESPAVMTIPLWVLAIGAIVVGWVGIGEDASPFFKFLAPSLHYAEHGALLEPAAWQEWLPLVFGIIGILLAWSMYMKNLPSPQGMARTFRTFYKLLKGKWYVDEIYDIFIVKPIYFLAVLLFKLVDRILIDGTVNGVAWLNRAVGSVLNKIQTGAVKTYMVWIVFAATLILWLQLLK